MQTFISRHTSTRTIVVYIACLAIALGLFAAMTSCGTPAFAKSEAAYKALQDNLAAIQTDGIVTPEEWAGHTALASAYYTQLKADTKEASKVDWKTLLPTAAGSIVASFLGVNAYRNNREQKVWGPPPPTPPSS